MSDQIHIPFHQFEVRFTPMLDFHQVGRRLMIPYVPLSSNYEIEFEGSHNERISLYIEEPKYRLYLAKDRAYVSCEGPTDILAKKNSFIEDPFFQIVDKLQQLPSFGSFVNFVYVTLYVIGRAQETHNDTVERLKHRFLRDDYPKLVRKLDDIAFVFSERLKDQDGELTVQYGPFMGEWDTIKRPVLRQYSNYDSLKEISGDMIEFKIFSKSRKIDFNLYENTVREERLTVQRIMETQ